MRAANLISFGCGMQKSVIQAALFLEVRSFAVITVIGIAHFKSKLHRVSY